MSATMETQDSSKEASAKYMAPLGSENTSPVAKGDSAFSFVMMLETSDFLKRLEAHQFSIFTQKFHKSISNTLRHFDGAVAKKDNNSYLVFFKSATNAVLCALKIQANFKYVTPNFDVPRRRLKIGISAGIPESQNKEINRGAITAVLRMCEVVADRLIISSTVKELYESENNNAKIDKDLIRTLTPLEEQFLKHLVDYFEGNWNKSTLNVRQLCAELDISYSQLYRRITKLTGKSPNAFIREFRLRKALRLLHMQFGNISEIAIASGFNSAAYFSKCFMGKFGILPSKYVQQHTF